MYFVVFAQALLSPNFNIWREDIGNKSQSDSQTGYDKKKENLISSGFGHFPKMIKGRPAPSGLNSIFNL